MTRLRDPIQAWFTLSKPLDSNILTLLGWPNKHHRCSTYEVISNAAGLSLTGQAAKQLCRTFLE
jgi:hypothetical protein